MSIQVISYVDDTIRVFLGDTTISERQLADYLQRRNWLVLPLSDADKEYIQRQCTCPQCGSDDIEGGSITVDGAGAHQDIKCLKCGKTWMDVYVLVGYEEPFNTNTWEEDNE